MDSPGLGVVDGTHGMSLDPLFAPLHEPVHAFVFDRLRERRPGRPLVVGLQAPQGAGKTTLVTHLLRRLPELGWNGTGVSVDDFYLTRSEQVALAATHPGNPYLEHRGYPGTHDVALGAQVLEALRECDAAARVVRVPVYDKSAHGGRGDRVPDADWREVRCPLDVVVVEGWMLGFAPVPDDALSDPHLRPANNALAAYGVWYHHVDVWIVLRAADPAYVLEWRVEAEERMKASGKPGLSREAITDYIRRFIPAYQTWADGTAAGRPPDLSVTIGFDRRPISR
ncbi:MAG: hypothetical protein AB7L71_20160 [Vicinamibacterales bacterium]